MIPFTFRQLEYFLAVAKTGSFREAAKIEHVSESALAAGIERLEKQLNTKLTIRRKSKGVLLTSAGKMFERQARPLVRSAAGLHDQLTGSDDSLTGTVVIGCTQAAAATLLPPILVGLEESHPGIEVQFEIAPRAKQLIPDLLSGDIDVVLTTLYGLPPGLSWENIHTREVLVMLPADHNLAAQDSITIQELETEPLILLDLSTSVERTLEIFRISNIIPQIRYRSDNTELVRSLVGRGLGLSLQIQRSSSEVSYEGFPVTYRPLTGGYTETAVVAWPEDGELSPQAKVVRNIASTMTSR